MDFKNLTKVVDTAKPIVDGSDEDGWRVPYSLKEFFHEFDDLEYEVRNCVRGCNTGCHSYQELADYIQGLADRLSECADEVRSIR